MIPTIIIDQDFIDFINICFYDISYLFKKQHDQCDHGQYSLMNFINAFNKYCSKNDQYETQYKFDYNCSDCSFPKFKNMSTGETEACPECGD